MRRHAAARRLPGEEFGTHAGLGWIGGTVRRIERSDPAIKIPHMGWNDVVRAKSHVLIEPGEAHFLHGYQFEVAGFDADIPLPPPTMAARSSLPSGRDNMIGVQFHPEKSQSYGLAFTSIVFSDGDRDAKPDRNPPSSSSRRIDLKGGQVVRLAEGDMDRATVYGDDPAAQAMIWSDQGSDFLHVVDLDGSFAGHAVNGAAIASIVQAFPGHVQLGGGIRDPQAVEGWFAIGVSRVVIGTAALKNPQFVKDMAADYPGGIVVAVDARDGMIATDGWAEKSDMPVVDLARRFEGCRRGVLALHRCRPRRPAQGRQCGGDRRSRPCGDHPGDCQRRRSRHRRHSRA